MKARKNTLGLLILSFLVFAGSGFAQIFEDQTAREQKIEKRYRDKLNQIIPADAYKLIVGVELKEQTKKVILSGEDSQEIKGTGDNKSAEKLPGFMEIEKQRKEKPKTQKASKNKYQMITYNRLVGVQIDLILSEGLPQGTADKVKIFMEKDVAASFGNRGTLNFSTEAMPKTETSASDRLIEWFKGWANTNGYTVLDWMILTGITILLLGVLFTIFKKIRNLKKKAELPAQDPNAINGGEKENEEVIIQGVLNDIVDATALHTSEVGLFLKQLQKESKETILFAIKTPALRTYFHTLMGYYGDLPKSGGEQGKLKESLLAIKQDLDRFLKIQDKQSQQQFGYLPLFNDNQLAQFVDNSENKLETLTVLARFISQSQFQTMLDKLSVAEKAEVLKLIQTLQINQETLDRLDTALRAQYEAQKSSGAVLATEGSELEKKFLENSSEIQSVIETLKAEKYDLGPAYEKYMVTFEKLVGLDKAIVSRVMQKVANETIAKAFAKQPFTAQVRESMGEMRSKLIESMKSQYALISKDEITKAQNEILREYWATV